MSRFLRWFSVAALVVALGGCSDSVAPPGAGDGNTDHDSENVAGSFQPAEGTFVLQPIFGPDVDGGSPVPVDLVGSDLRVDPNAQTVTVDVALRNKSEAGLYGPVLVWLHDFSPREVQVTNPDVVTDSSENGPLPQVGFEYSNLLGEDEVLTAGETSGAKTWIFRVPDLVAFSFAARAEFGLVPDLARIGGMIFQDRNGNGTHDPDEEPAVMGSIRVQNPQGETAEAHPGPDGRYAVPAEYPGLYQVLYVLPPGQDFPVLTTPNPRSVLLTPDSTGRPESFLDADFGLRFEVPPPDTLCDPVRMTDRPLQELGVAPWTLLDFVREGDQLFLHVRFAGCGMMDPFTVYSSGGFMESEPVQINILPVHEAGQDCNREFETRLCVDLRPIRRAYAGAYGQEHGTVILRLYRYGLDGFERVEYTF
jgi:hypothetical protein